MKFDHLKSTITCNSQRINHRISNFFYWLPSVLNVRPRQETRELDDWLIYFPLMVNNEICKRNLTSKRLSYSCAS
jgi:hypothetical protein